jgi:hypothetical protein
VYQCEHNEKTKHASTPRKAVWKRDRNTFTLPPKKTTRRTLRGSVEGGEGLGEVDGRASRERVGRLDQLLLQLVLRELGHLQGCGSSELVLDE